MSCCDDAISEQEMESLIKAALRTGPKFEPELLRVINWAREVRTGAAMLTLVLGGEVDISLAENDIAFTAAKG